MSSTLKGRAAIVTGAGSGIGAACATTLAARGAPVIVADIDEDGGAKTVRAIRDSGGEAEFVHADVSRPASVESMVRTTVERYGGLRIAVNNAGIGGASAKIGDYDVEDWKRVIEINLGGVFYCLRHEIPAMLDAGGGAIVNMASILGSVGFPSSAGYVAAKHGVVGLTKNAALEYAAEGIRVNAVGPGFVETPLIEEGLDADAKEQVTAMHPVGHLGTPEEIAALVAFLVSDEASFITGSYHLADGGYTAR